MYDTYVHFVFAFWKNHVRIIYSIVRCATAAAAAPAVTLTRRHRSRARTQGRLAAAAVCSVPSRPVSATSHHQLLVEWFASCVWYQVYCFCLFAVLYVFTVGGWQRRFLSLVCLPVFKRQETQEQAQRAAQPRVDFFLVFLFCGRICEHANEKTDSKWWRAVRRWKRVKTCENAKT